MVQLKSDGKTQGNRLVVKTADKARPAGVANSLFARIFTRDTFQTEPKKLESDWKSAREFFFVLFWGFVSVFYIFFNSFNGFFCIFLVF